MAIACRRDPQVTLRIVTPHAPKACAPDGNAYVSYEALGDFNSMPAASGHLLRNTGEPLPEIDDTARALLARANENGRDWAGLANVPGAGNVDLLLLPLLTSCSMSMSVDQRVGATLAPVPGGQLLFVGGMRTDKTPQTFIVDWATGDIESARTGLAESRALASVTEFGDGALVAGGIGDSGVLATAEVYEPSLHDFDAQHRFQIGSARADHGAVELATGETLLVGGIGADGKTLLASMQTVDPLTRTVRTEGIARLAVARRAPSVLRLASGEVLVAGGFDQSDAPVATLEWFAPDASQATRRARDLATGTARAFIPLAAGGAIAVIAPPAGAPTDFQNTWIIDADGALEAASPVQGTLTAPVLFEGTSGAPVLWTGDRWLRWEPWQGAFGALDVLDEAPPRIGEATCSPEAGVALWIASDTQLVTALRFDVGSEYAPLPGPLLVTDASGTAPDRLAAAGALSFDPALGLVLGPGVSAFVTDRTYAGVSIDVDAPTGEPALVVLRDESGAELEVGGSACPGATSPGTMSIHLMRKGSTVTWNTGGGADTNCANAVRENARLSIGFRAPASATRSVVRNLRITRVP
jgi:hypothetical protein